MLWHMWAKSDGLLIIGSDERLNVLLCKSLHRQCQRIEVITQPLESLLDRDFSLLQRSCKYGPHAEEYFETRLSLEILFVLWQRQSDAQP